MRTIRQVDRERRNILDTLAILPDSLQGPRKYLSEQLRYLDAERLLLRRKWS